MPMPATAMQAEATPWRLRATISQGKVLTTENTERENVQEMLIHFQILTLTTNPISTISSRFLLKAERRSVAVPHMSGAEYPNRAVTVPTRGLMASCTKAFEANRAPENG